MSTVLPKPSVATELQSGSRSPRYEQFISRLLTTDFCPQLNRYVYWLKEPIGWFALAALASLLVGAFLSPIGWTLAAGLIALILAGLALPWIAVRFSECRLEPINEEFSEMESNQLLLTVRNRLPIPLWGLMIKGYLATPIEQHGLIGDASIDNEVKPDVGLACVPPLCEATFRLSVRPEYRGVYPVEVPLVACAFPFGIWTAHRKVQQVTPVTVWPMRLDLSGLLDIGGTNAADEGVGERVGTSGEFLGVRAFRRGDSLRSIHWVQTARLDSLVVCDRSGPQRQTVSLEIDTRPMDRHFPTDNLLAARNHLAWRVRIVASLAELLSARHIPFQLVIDDQVHALSSGQRGLKQALDLLANVPLDSVDLPEAISKPIQRKVATRICISPASRAGHHASSSRVAIAIHQPSNSLRSHQREHSTDLLLNDELTSQLNHFLSEASHACFAA